MTPPHLTFPLQSCTPCDPALTGLQGCRKDPCPSPGMAGSQQLSPVHCKSILTYSVHAFTGQGWKALLRHTEPRRTGHCHTLCPHSSLRLECTCRFPAAESFLNASLGRGDSTAPLCALMNSPPNPSTPTTCLRTYSLTPPLSPLNCTTPGGQGLGLILVGPQAHGSGLHTQSMFNKRLLDGCRGP